MGEQEIIFILEILRKEKLKIEQDLTSLRAVIKIYENKLTSKVYLTDLGVSNSELNINPDYPDYPFNKKLKLRIEYIINFVGRPLTAKEIRDIILDIEPELNFNNTVCNVHYNLHKHFFKINRPGEYPVWRLPYLEYSN